jgi:hypothetical protein
MYSNISAALALLLLPPPVLPQDTVVVRADNEPIWGETPHIVEELRIGQLDGPDEYVLGRIGPLTVRADGDIIAVDAQAPVIRQYDANGRYVRDIGREGAGPGEYRRVTEMQILADGRLAILDPGNTRISIYDSTGVFIASHRVEGVYGVDAFVVDTLGNFWVKQLDQSRLPTREDRIVEPVEPRERPWIFTEISPSGEVLRSIDIPPEERSWPSFVLMTTEGRRWSFPDLRAHALSNRGYLVVGHNRTYALDLWLPEGRVRRITRTAEAVALRDGERAQWQAWVRFFEEANQGRLDYPPLPRTKPFFRALTVDRDGRIWVERYVEAIETEPEPRAPGDDRPLREWREPPTFDVIKPDGTFLGTVVLPRDTYAYVRSGWHIWGVRAGELREPYIVRLRIEPASR